ncbi:5088_t:CDS:2 [Paraglomus brasilianum]|uniref:5088_t:CDS:1 n=1 Tax=Paraglomus brasilianum TaxID=144538 RepID=A0A9N9C2X3_9GLOM|nr:5088_t:CDS:2 [Paraglomus brasilianum]
MYKSQKNFWLQRKQPTDETGTLLYTKRLEPDVFPRNAAAAEVLTVRIKGTHGERRPERGERQPKRGERQPERGERQPERGERRPERSERRPERSQRRPERLRLLSLSASPVPVVAIESSATASGGALSVFSLNSTSIDKWQILISSSVGGVSEGPYSVGGVLGRVWEVDMLNKRKNP